MSDKFQNVRIVESGMDECEVPCDTSIGSWDPSDSDCGLHAIEVFQDFMKSDHNWLVIVKSDLSVEGFGFATKEDAIVFTCDVENYDPDMDEEEDSEDD